MPESRLQSRSEATPRRDRIIDETLRIVGERGYHGFGIQELAERCGLTKPGLLHHFGSKDQLLIAVLNEVDAKQESEIGALFGAAFERAESAEVAREMFRRSILTIVEKSLAQPELMRLRVVLRVESINPDHPAHDYFLGREKVTLERLSRGTAAFSAHPRSTARQILAMLSGFEQQWLREAASFDLLGEWDRVLDMVLSTDRPAST